jgi:hypothetical protein
VGTEPVRIGLRADEDEELAGLERAALTAFLTLLYLLFLSQNE